MYRGYKIRLYPTKEQEELFKKHIGCCRFIYNYMLDLQKKNYEDGGKFISGFNMIRMLTPLKKDKKYSWLNEVSNTSLQKTCMDLQQAFKNFFNNEKRYPIFKSKHKSKQIFPIAGDRLYFIDKIRVQIQKCGLVKYKTDYKICLGKVGCKFINPRISYVNRKWILSFSMECENQTLQNLKGSMGIDLGIKELVVVSYDNKIEHFHNINKSKKMRNLEKRIKHYQRSIAKKKKGSNNREREKLKMRKLYAKQANIRNNYIHQTTRKLVNKRPQRVVMEDLNVIGLMKNHHLAKAIQEQKFYEFRRQMQYKCEWAGIEFVLVDRFYPSSKTCSCCGNVKKDLKLSNRIYRCEKCGLIIDRDENAAKNLEKYIA